MKISIILVRPRNPQNIGAAARAMGNFGLSDLRVVSPYPPVWEEVISAPHAQDIIKNAKVFETLPAALADADYTLATTSLDGRKKAQKIVYLDSLGDFFKETPHQNIAIIFGPEKTGLAAGEIALANAVLNIPTTSKTPSINLAQAVILCCWEISKNKMPRKRAAVQKKPTFKEKEIVLENIENLLNLLDFPPTLNQNLRARHMRDINNKDALSKENIFFINTVINKIIKRLKS